MSQVARLALPALGLLVGFAAGTVFGVAVLGDAGPPVEAPAPRDPPRQAASGGDSAERARDDAPAPGPRRRGVSTDDVAVENALRGGDVASAGEGVITGEILDANGNGMVGVEIVATPEFSPESDEDEPETLEARLREVVRYWRFQEGAKRTTTTGPGGAYRVDRLVEGEYAINPQLAGFRFRVPSNGSWTVYTGGKLDFLAIPVIEITADVSLPDGSPPESAQLEIRDLATGETFYDSWTPETRAFDAGPGSYEISATGGEQDAFRVVGVPLEVVDGEGASVALHLEARPGIAGAITFAGAEKPTIVGVVLASMADGGEADPARLVGSQSATWVGDPFEYSLLDVTPGPYLVGVMLRNGRVLDHTVFEIGPGLMRHDVAIGDVDVRDYVLVRVYAPDGSTADDVSIQVGYSGPGGESYGEVATEKTEDGAHKVPHSSPGGPEMGFSWSSTTTGAAGGAITHFVVATSETFGTQRATYDPLRDREVSLTFEPPAFALVHVDTGGRRGMPGRLSVGLVPPGVPGSGFGVGPGVSDMIGGEFFDLQSAGSQGEVSAQVGLDGNARVGPVAPGTYSVKLYANSDEVGARHVATTRITLGAGETPVSMSLPELHSLRIRVEGADLDLDLHPVAAADATTDFLDEGIREGAGVTRFSMIPPGRYRVRSYGEGSVGEMIVAVPASGTITFRATPYDSIRVESVPPAWRGALEFGDLIVAIGGQEMPSDHRIMAALALARSQEDMTVTVVRSGREMDVSVPTAAIDEASLVRMTR